MIAKVLECIFAGSDIELQTNCHDHFWTNSLGNKYEPTYLPSCSTRINFGIKYTKQKNHNFPEVEQTFPEIKKKKSSQYINCFN